VIEGVLLQTLSDTETLELTNMALDITGNTYFAME
jgi:hypothetical protein